MNQIYVLLGSFTFIEPTLVYPKHPIKQSGGLYIHCNQAEFIGEYRAIIHRIDSKVFIDEDKLDEFCENALDNYEGYLIPAKYNGKICYEH